MATIAIKYGELKSAARNAGQVSQKLTTYANSINNTVLNKLNSYSGDRTGNISTAVSNARNKNRQLEEDSKRYSAYSGALKNLEEDCKNTDKRVADRVKNLTGTFKASHGIKTNAILDGFSRFMTSIANSNPVFRWIGNNIVDRAKEGWGYLKDSIKEWYHYKGGKQLIKGLADSFIGIAAAIAGIILAIPTAPITGIAAAVAAVVGVVVACVGGAIAITNGITNMANEIGGYVARQNGNASLGYRLSHLDSYTDTLRTFSDDKGVHRFANIVDGVEFVCEVIDFIKNAGTLVKKGYKWATHSLDSLKNIKWKDILSRGTLGQFAGKLKSSVSDGLSSVSTAIKTLDYNYFRNAANSFNTDFLYSLEKRFGNFSDAKSTLSSLKNIVSFGKDLIDMEDLSFKSIAKTLAANIVLPCVNLVGMDVVDRDGNGFFMRDSTGQLEFGKSEFISLNDIFSKQLLDNILDLPKHLSFGDMFKSFNWIDKGAGFWKDGCEIVDKLFGKSEVDISIPEIYVPQIHIQINMNIDIHIRPVNTLAGQAA